MTYISRGTFVTWLDANIGVNGSQAITGLIHNKEAADLSENTTWWDERTKVLYYDAFIITSVETSAPDQVNDGKRYIQKWDAAPDGTSPEYTASAYNTITYWNGDAWVIDPAFDASLGLAKDWLIYDEDEDSHWRFDWKTQKWTIVGNLGELIDHNKTFNKQGGTVDEYLHLTQAEYDLFTGLSVFKPLNLDVVITGVDPSSPVAGKYYIEDDIIKSWSGSAWVTHAEWATISEFNIYALNETDSCTYVYDYANDSWGNIGENIHVNHNSTFGKQGGTTDEYFHQTEAENIASTRLATRVKYLGTDSVVEFVGNGSNLPTSATIGDLYLSNSGVHEYGSSGFSLLIDTSDNKEYWFTAVNNGVTYISSLDNTLFLPANAAQLWVHNNQIGLQGGDITNRIHLTQGEYDSLDFAGSEYEQTIYIDPIAGNDSNDGSLITTSVKTENGIVSNIKAAVLNIIVRQGTTLIVTEHLSTNAVRRNVNVINFSGEMELVTGANSVEIEQVPGYTQLYEYAEATPWAGATSDSATGLYYYGTDSSTNTPIRGCNIVDDATSTNDTIVINRDMGSSALTDNVYQLTTEVTIGTDYVTDELIVTFDSLIVNAASNASALSENNKFNKSLLILNGDYASDAYFQDSTIKINRAATLALSGKITFDDLMITSEATDITDDSRIIEYQNNFEGSALTVYGFNTVFNGHPKAVVKVDDYFVATCFNYLIDPSNGGYYDFQTDNTLVANPVFSVTGLVGKHYFIGKTVSMIAEESIYINILGFKISNGLAFEYKDMGTPKGIYWYKRDSENIKILHSEEEKERSVYTKSFTSSGTTVSLDDLYSTTGTSSMKFDINIMNTSSGKYQQVSVSLDILSDTAVLFGSAGSTEINDVTMAGGSVILAGLTTDKDYIVQIDITRFFK